MTETSLDFIVKTRDRMPRPTVLCIDVGHSELRWRVARLAERWRAGTVRRTVARGDWLDVLQLCQPCGCRVCVGEPGGCCGSV